MAHAAYNELRNYGTHVFDILCYWEQIIEVRWNFVGQGKHFFLSMRNYSETMAFGNNEFDSGGHDNGYE